MKLAFASRGIPAWISRIQLFLALPDCHRRTGSPASACPLDCRPGQAGGRAGETACGRCRGLLQGWTEIFSDVDLAIHVRTL